MPLLSLAHFTVIDADPLTLIDVGAAAGFDAVGLRIVLPPGAPPIAPVVGDPAMQRRIKARLAATGMKILDTEALWLLPETDVSALAPVLDTTAELGAAHFIVCSNDPDRARALDNLARLCEAANFRGVRVMFEFLPYTEVRSLPEAHALLEEIKPANAGILVDAVHLSRSGGSPAISPHTIHPCSVSSTSVMFRSSRRLSRTFEPRRAAAGSIRAKEACGLTRL
jgi:sugar phosphate isomerase/epimerase